MIIVVASPFGGYPNTMPDRSEPRTLYKSTPAAFGVLEYPLDYRDRNPGYTMAEK